MPSESRLRALARSSSARLAVLYLVLYAGSVSLLFGFIYWATAGYMARQTDATIEAEIEGLAEHYRQHGLDALVSVIAERVARNPGRSSVYLFADSDFRRLAGNISRWPEAEVDEQGWIDFELRDSEEAEPILARARPFRLRGGLNLLVGRDISELIETRELIRRALYLGLGITLALGIAGGIVFSMSTLRRVESINRTSRRIMQGELGERVPLRGTGDDFDQLAANLNAMLERIERLMWGVQAVSDNIAHDLRTPLARLRQRLEDLQRQDLPPASAEMLERCLTEADQMLATFNALLRIARIEAGAQRRGDAEIDLGELAGDAVELYEALAEERGQQLAVEAAPAIRVRGDRDLLFQALSNLIDNAIKYTHEGGAITVRAAAGESGPELVVADNGPGIAEQERERISERFYRGAAAEQASGSGLGLALVAAIADLHEARLAFEDNAPGLRARLQFHG